MKILSIGNSFSQDAQKYLHDIANADDFNLYCANLYIGGCSLEKHYKNILCDIADYDYEINGNESKEKISIKSALEREDWDIVTVQQVSSFSGMIGTYFPFIKHVIAYVKKIRPNAKIFLHQTWAYEQDSDHGAFPNYDCNQLKMYESIVKTNDEVAKQVNIKTIIPCGEVIQKLRNTNLFTYKNGENSLCRDGFHMHYCFGRYATALTWYKVLTGKDILNNSFLPPCEEKDENYDNKISLIKETVNEIKNI